MYLGEGVLREGTCRDQERLPMMLSWSGASVDYITLCGCNVPQLNEQDDVVQVYGITVTTDLGAPTTANPAFFARCSVCGQTLKRWFEVPDPVE